MLKKDFSLSPWRNFIRGGVGLLQSLHRCVWNFLNNIKVIFIFVLYLIQFFYIFYLFRGFLPVHSVLSNLMVLIWLLPLPFFIYCIPKYTFLINLRGGGVVNAEYGHYFLRSIFVSTPFSSFSYLLYSIIQIVDKLGGGVEMDYSVIRFFLRSIFVSAPPFSLSIVFQNTNCW